MRKKDRENYDGHKGLRKYIDDVSGFARYTDDQTMTIYNIQTDHEWYEKPFEPYKYNLIYQLDVYRTKHKILRPAGEYVVLPQYQFVTWDTWDVPMDQNFKYTWDVGQINFLDLDNNDIVGV